ncbi:hypothetical protein EON63_02305 [archaeon]|nr:MAG: hypothetical protein EON63_02305 [archaeon]
MKREKNKNKNKNIDLNKRFVYAHTQSEIAYVYGQRGIHKVRSALCYNTSLLPDEDLRIFTTVGDYVSFMSSPGGKVYKQKIHTRYKREQSIFNMPNPYHTHTHTPNIVYIRVCEVMGVIASPLVGMAYVSGVMYQYVSKMVYGAIHALHTHYIHTRHIQGGDEVYAHPIHSVYDVMGRCAQVVMDMDNENSYVFKNYITYLYSDYNPLYALSNIVYGYLYYPAYTYTIMYYAPYLYFTYYTHTPAHSHTPSDSHTHADPYTYLPQRRQCCLLRVGLGYLQEELLKIQKKIRTLVQLQDMKATMSVVKEDAAEDANKDSVKNKKPWSVKNTIQSVKGMFSDVKETTSRRETRDYGILGEYESIKDVCVSKVYDTYNYTVCFFDRIIQTKVHTHTENGVDVPPSPSHTHTHTHTPRKEEYSLGKFSMWNISDPYPYTILNTYRDIQHHHHTQQQRTQHLYDNDGDVYGKMVSMGMEFLESMYVLPSYLFEQFVLKGLRQEDMSVVRGMLPFNHTLHPYYDRVMEYVYVYNQSMYDREGLLHTHTPSVEVQEIQSRLNREMDMYYGKQFYTDGTPCVIHNTPSPSSPHTPSHTHTQVIPRNTEVIFQCAADHEIVYVMEKSVCSYSITVTSPLACTERMEREFLDRLDALGVFGFSKKKG